MGHLKVTVFQLTMYPRAFRELVKRIYELHKTWMSFRYLANFLNIPKTTLHRWIRSDASTRRNHCKPKVTNRFLETIESTLEQLPYISVRDLSSRTNTSSTTAYRGLKSLGYRYGRIYEQGNGRDLTERRTLFSKEMKNVERNNVAAIDETSLYLQTNPTRCWSKKGQRKHFPIQRVQSKRYTVISAITCSSVYTKVVPGAANSTIFQNFITEMPFDKEYVLMDNVSFHKNRGVLDCMKKRNMKPLFTSPYSPEWNPTEMYFSYIKRELRKTYHNRGTELSHRLNEINAQIDPTYFDKWFKRVWNHITMNYHR